MRRLIKIAVLVIAFVAVAASTATATVGPAMLASNSPIGTGTNRAPDGTWYGWHEFLPPWTFAQIRCTDASFSGTALTTATATVDPSYSGCFYTTPLFGWSAQVHVTCPWTLAFDRATFNNATGATTGGTLTMSCTKITVPSSNCTVNFTSQTREGVSLQNIDATGLPSTSLTPWGSKITVTTSSLTFTATGTGCTQDIGATHHGAFPSYTGTWAIRNVWSKL